MISKPIVLILLAAGCVTAAAGGAYVAVRHNSADQVTVARTLQPAAQSVAETEAVVNSPAAASPPKSSAAPLATKPAAARVEESPRQPVSVKKEAPPVSRPSSSPSRSSSEVGPEQPMAVERPAPSREATAVAPAPAPIQPEPAVTEPPPTPARPPVVEVVVPAAAVVGLRVETSITSETARVEDRVEARVTRDVTADGRVAVPAGTRVIGDVVLVERGGKMKDKARLGVRFHTLVMANGDQVGFCTDSIYRDGASPGNESARKIGGAAIGGAILGAIMGGAKGAAIGGATGAGAGSAVVMSGDRNAATLPAGTVLTVRLTSPVTMDIEQDN